MNQEPFVSVIIPVYNDHVRLRACLAALENQTYRCDRYEVVVVDNGSSSPVCTAIAAFPHAVAEFESRQGSYAARNRGLAVAQGEVMAFTDADCLPALNWIEEGVAAINANPGCGFIAGQVRVVPRDQEAPTMVEQYELAFGFPQARYVNLGFGATANLFTRRDVIERVGGFATEFLSGGDREWGMRVKASGYDVFYADPVRIDHPARRTWSELIKKTVRTNRGMFELGRKQGKSLRHTARLVLTDLRPPVRWIARLMQAEAPVGLRAKLSVVVVLIFNRWLRAGVWLWLEAGSSLQRYEAVEGGQRDDANAA